MFGNLDLVGVHAPAARDRAGDRPAGGRARRRDPAGPGAVRPHRRRARRPGTTPGLDDEAVRLVERYHLDFVLAGAQLDEAGRARLTELNQELSTLSTTFGQNLQLATEAAAVQVADAAELDGLDDEEIAAAATAAADRGRRGLPAHAAAAHRPAGADQAAQPGPAPPGLRGLASAARPRGSTTTARSRVRIARLRAERARLLGFDTHADLVLADSTARTTAAVDAMLASMVPASVANAEAEAAVLAEAAGPRRRRARAVGLGVLQRAGPGRAVRRRHHGAAPYFELDRVLVDGVFHAAELLYGFRFTRAPGPGRLPPRRPRVGGHRRRRHRGRALPRRLLRPRGQARRGVDELVRPPVAAARHPAGRGQQPQRVPGRRTASRRCSPSTRSTRSSTSSATRCTG